MPIFLMSPPQWVVLIHLLLFLQLVVGKTFSIDLKQSSYLRDSVIADSTRTGYTTLGSFSDMYYVGTVELGTPPQTFSVKMDTGTATFWVIDSKCNTASCNGMQSPPRHKFNPAASSTFISTTQEIQLPYEHDYCNLTIAKDTLQFAGFTVDNQMIGLASAVEDSLENQPIDGVFGLGFSPLTYLGVTPPLFNIMSQLDNKVFSVSMGRESDPSAGRITFGAFDDQFCDSNVMFVNLTEKSYWHFKLTYFNMGYVNVWLPYGQAISDTGSPFILLPNPYLAMIVNNVTNATFNESLGLYTIPCDSIASLPPMTFTLDNYILNVTAFEYTVKMQGMCFLAIGKNPQAQWVLGDPFIRSYCQHYDIENGRIGFSKPKCAKFSSAPGCSSDPAGSASTTSTTKTSNSWVTQEAVTTQVSTTTQLSSNPDSFFLMFVYVTVYIYVLRNGKFV